MKFETLSIHAGQEPDPATGAVSVPIFQTSTFAFISAGHPHKDMYSRVSNPTRTALETSLAALEHGKFGFAFSSGMAAETTVLELLNAGDRILVHRELYGGTYRLLSMATTGRRYDLEYIDAGNPDELRTALARPTKLVWIETPTNPLMTLIDIAETARIVHEAGALLLVDNTFLSPYFQNPLTLGADIVVHSGTKFLGGHNDTLAGFLVTNREEISEQLCFLIKTTGAGLAPFDSWLILRGIKTLGIRMEQAQKNELEIANWLKTQPAVTKVIYPGLPEHPGYEIMKKQARGFGSMLTFYVDSKEHAFEILEKVRMIKFAESLGGVETLLTYPTTQTHADVPQEIREKNGITDCTLRLSVGIEAARDLIAELTQVFAELS